MERHTTSDLKIYQLGRLNWPCHESFLIWSVVWADSSSPTLPLCCHRSKYLHFAVIPLCNPLSMILNPFLMVSFHTNLL